MSLEARLKRALSSSGRPSSDYDLNPEVILPKERSLRAASVLVPIISGSKPRVILTMRSSALKHHPGQIAFPGGTVEDSDLDETAAALRESHEEIGLDAKHVDVLGHLPAHETVTGFQVTPVLAMINDAYSPKPDPNEVAEVFTVPLHHVLDTTNYRAESRRWRGHRRFYFAVPWGPYYIWGATARILRALADRMSDEQN